jgi:hypothetical protein
MALVALTALSFYAAPQLFAAGTGGTSSGGSSTGTSGGTSSGAGGGTSGGTSGGVGAGVGAGVAGVGAAWVSESALAARASGPESA